MSAIRFVFLLLLLCIVTSAFAASYQDPRGRFTFAVPAGWSVIVTGENDTNVSDGAAAYVRIVKVPGGGKDMRLVKRVTDQIGTQWEDFTQGEHGSVTFAGQSGIYVFFTGVNPKKVPATMRVVAAPFGEDAFMLIMSCPSADFTITKEAFKQIENSFALSSGRSKPAEHGPDGVLPPQDPPKGMQSFDEPNGGRIVSGGLENVDSAPAAFKAGLRQMRGYFDASPKLLSAVQSKDGNLVLSTFSATARHAEVNGFVVATYDPAGNSRFAVLFDTPERFVNSLPSMQRRLNSLTDSALERMRPADEDATMDFAAFEKASKHVTLDRISFPDGTASIGLALGFKPQTMNGGAFFATGADEAYIRLFNPYPMLDPNGSLYQLQERVMRNSGGSARQVPGQMVIAYDPDPVSAYKKYQAEAARRQGLPNPNPHIVRSDPFPGVSGGFTGRIVTGTMTLRGKTFVFTARLLVGPPPDAQGNWMLQVTILGAPAAHAAEDMPGLIAMQQSINVDMNAVRNQTMRNIALLSEQTARWLAANKAAGDATRNARFDSAVRNAAAARDSLDRSTAGFIHYISDQAVVRHDPSGARRTLDTNLASALEQADPQHFSVVPVKEYIKGVDY